MHFCHRHRPYRGRGNRRHRVDPLVYSDAPAPLGFDEAPRHFCVVPSAITFFRNVSDRRNNPVDVSGFKKKHVIHRPGSSFSAIRMGTRQSVHQFDLVFSGRSLRRMR